MRFSVTAVLAFAATAFAQAADFDPIYTPKSGESIPAGSTYTITWDTPAKYADSIIDIELIGGATQNTQQKLGGATEPNLGVVATGVANNLKSYSWKVDNRLGDEAVYGLVFRDQKNPQITFQYSQPFHIKKAADKQPSGSSSGAVTLTKSHGIKTVTLSTVSTSAAATSTPATTSAPPTTSTYTQTVKVNTTLPCNTTTMAVETSSGQSAPVVIPSSAGFKPTTASTAVATPTAAANVVRVGSLTILGVVAAVLAL